MHIASVCLNCVAGLSAGKAVGLWKLNIEKATNDMPEVPSS
jgi:hypothetical protein